MSKLKSFVWLALIILAPVVVAAEDPGVRDTVLIEGGPLYLGQSVPLRFRIVNDNIIRAMVIGTIVRSVDGGFARFDSLVWTNRMADPSVMPFRANAGLRVNGSEPDSIMFGAALSAPPSNGLPIGSEDIGLVYFTGVQIGSIKIDSSFLGGGSTFLMQPACCGAFVPEFVAGEFEIVAGSPPPIILSPRSSIQGVVVSELAISLEIVSTGLGGIGISSSSIVKLDDPQITPSSTPTAMISDSLEINWIPNALDVGVWEYSLVICDTAGNCDTVLVEFDVVIDEESLVDFTIEEFDVAIHWTGLHHGDLDHDGRPEIVATGAALNVTSRMAVFKYDPFTGLSIIQQETDDNFNLAPAIGFLDTDDDLDLITFGPAATYQSFSIVARFFAGSSGALLDLIDESLSSPLQAPRDSKIAELTGDGRLDVVNVGHFTVSILSSNSSNVMVPFSQFTVPDSIKSVNTGDFDRDGDIDLALGTVSNLLVYLNDGSGVFTAGQSYPQDFRSMDIEVTNQGSDFNEDGIFDLCIATPSVGGLASELIIYTGDGNGGFTQEVIRTLLGQVSGNTIGDFNDDTHLDIAFLNASRREVGVLLGDGDGGFENELRYSISHLPPRRIDCLDIDSDGDLDIVVGSSQELLGGALYVLKNMSDPDGLTGVDVTIAGMNNIALGISAQDGSVLNSVRNSMPGSEFYFRDVDVDGSIDDFVSMGIAKTGAHIVTASPSPAYSAGSPFTLEMKLDGVTYRLAKDLPMAASGYSFEIYPSGGSPFIPINGSFVPSDAPSFFVQTTTGFDLEISEDISFATLLHSASVEGPLYSLPISLPVVDTAIFYWRYRVTGGGVWSGPIALNALVANGATCGDLDGSGSVNIGDIVYGIARIFVGGPAPVDPAGGDVNASGSFNIADISYMISYIFTGGSAPVCP